MAASKEREVVSTGVAGRTRLPARRVDLRPAVRRIAGGLTPLALAAVLPFLLPNDYQVHLMSVVMIWAIYALGFNVAFGYAGLVNLGDSALMAVGSYTLALVTTELGVNPWLAILLGTLLAALVGGLIGTVTARVGGHYLALATLALGVVAEQVLLAWQGLTKGSNGVVGIPPLTVGEFTFNTPSRFLWVTGAALGLTIVASSLLRASFLGRSMEALRDSEAVAKARGVPTTSRKILALGVCGATAGLAGSLYATFIGYIDPSSFTVAGNAITVMAIALLGGAGSIPGTVCATALLILIPQEFQSIGSWYPLIYGFVIVLIVLFLRGGLASLPAKVASLFRRVARRRAVARS
jgi:branched-chain amino acid transport system permease protein